MAEGGALLRRYGGEFLHRGFESLLLRYWFGFHQFFRKLRRVTRSTRGRCPFGGAGSGAGDRPAWSRRGRGPSALGARPCRPGSTRGTGQRTLLVVHAHGWRRLPWRFQHKRCAPKPGRNCCSQFGSGGSCFGLLDQFDEPLPRRRRGEPGHSPRPLPQRRAIESLAEPISGQDDVDQRDGHDMAARRGSFRPGFAGRVSVSGSASNSISSRS